MNALVAGEYDKLTPFQKLKFNELVAWQNTSNKGGPVPMDSGAYFKILDWVKKLPTPPAEPVEQEE